MNPLQKKGFEIFKIYQDDGISGYILNCFGLKELLKNTKERKSDLVLDKKMYVKKVFIRSFGCQMNDADSEVMERLLEREGYGKINSPEGADVMILNKE